MDGGQAVDVINRIEHGMADIEDAARVRKLVAALIDALDVLAERGVDAGVHAVMRRGLDALGEVLRDA
jgi:hypothetical protein